MNECVCVCGLVKAAVLLSAIKASQQPTVSFNQLNVPVFVCVCVSVCMFVCFCLPLRFFVFHHSLKRWRFIKDRTRPVMTVPFMSPGEIQ